MALSHRIILILLVRYACGAPANDAEAKKAAIPTQDLDQEKDDLKAAASNSYSRRYSDWGGGYPGSYSYGVTGYGTIDDRYNTYYSSGAGLGGYDGYYGYNSGLPGGGYNSRGYGGGYGLTGYNNYGGYSSNGNSGYGSGYSGYGSGYSGGYGGYGGLSGNGGLNSYYGYNNPNYQGGYHLGYGYYNSNKRGYGNIYQNGVTPSLVTGYRGYSRRRR